MSNTRIRLDEYYDAEPVVYDNPSYEDPNYPLNAREEQFCRELLIDNNQTQAAIRAGYAVSSARQTASRIMTKENVRLFVSILRTERNDRIGIDADWVLKRLMLIADSNLLDFCRWTPRAVIFKPSQDLTRDQGFVLSSVIEKIGKGGEQQLGIKLEKKLPSLVVLAKETGVGEGGSKTDDVKSFVENLRREVGNGNFFDDESEAEE